MARGDLPTVSNLCDGVFGVRSCYTMLAIIARKMAGACYRPRWEHFQVVGDGKEIL
jgi:hypothetical protein